MNTNIVSNVQHYALPVQKHAVALLEYRRIKAVQCNMKLNRFLEKLFWGTERYVRNLLKQLVFILASASVLFLFGCMQDEKEQEPMLKKQNGGDQVETSLHHAVKQRDSETVEKLITDGTDLNKQDAKGQTPLMIATYNHDFEMAKKLVDAGADVNLQDDMQNSPFLYAGAEGYIDILKLCIGSNADTTITNRYGGTALIPASERGHVETVEVLLKETDIDVNHINNLGWTALLEAIILGDGSKSQTEIVRLLVNHGADVNIADKDGTTPLAHARNKGYGDIEGVLLKAGSK